MVERSIHWRYGSCEKVLFGNPPSHPAHQLTPSKALARDLGQSEKLKARQFPLGPGVKQPLEQPSPRTVWNWKQSSIELEPPGGLLLARCAPKEAQIITVEHGLLSAPNGVLMCLHACSFVLREEDDTSSAFSFPDLLHSSHCNLQASCSPFLFSSNQQLSSPGIHCLQGSRFRP